MKKTVRRWRLVARVLVLAVAIAAVPVPSLAQEKSPPASTPGIQASIQKVAASTPVAPARTPAARSQTNTTAPKSSFMKSTAGIVMLAVLGAGIGYVAYSTSHDRINSPGR